MRLFALASIFVLSLFGAALAGGASDSPKPAEALMNKDDTGLGHARPLDTSGPAQTAARPLLFLGNQSLPPMNYLKRGKPTGIVIDLTEALARHMRRPVTIRLMDWGEAQQRVLEGGADALLQINASPERTEIFDFSGPLLESEFSIFTSADRYEIESMTDLRGLMVGVEKKGLPIQLLKEDPQINVKVIPDFAQGFEMLSKGAVDAIVADRWVGSFVLAENHIHNVKMVSKPISSSHSAIAVKKGNSDLLAEINEALAIIRQDGTYDSILKRWRPKEVVYKTREQLRQQALQWAMAAISLALLVALVGGAAQAREIRRRRRSEDALRKSQAMLNTVLDTVPQSIFWKGHDGRYLGCNRAFASAMGLDDPQEIKGLRNTDLPGWSQFKIEDRQTEDQGIINQNHSKHFTIKVLKQKDGTWRSIDVYKLPIPDVDGIPFALLGVCEDITDRIRMQEILIQSEKMSSVGVLAAGLAHEINNPLSAVLQSMQVLLRRLSLDSPRNQAVAQEAGCSFENIKAFLEAREVYVLLESVRESGTRAAQIVSNMLEFSRKTETEKSLTDLNALLNKAVEICAADYDLQKKYDFRKIGIEREFDPHLPLVPCSPGQIEQVLVNLLRNAAQAMQGGDDGSQGPRIVLRTKSEENEGIIEVQDNGPGMAEETLNHIFDPFYTTKGVGKGTGLGLSVSYFIITEKHGGTIHVDSVRGEGSKFTIRLPLQDSSAPHPTARPS